MAVGRTAVLRAGAFALCVCALVAASAAPVLAATPDISPIEAVFVPSELATEYTVGVVGASPGDVSYTWTLRLTLVDPAGAPAPNQPETGAAVDPTCDNAHLAGGKAAGAETFTWDNVKDAFTWFHGDKGSYPDTYGCNHKAMGPSGHEGIVSVVVSTNLWTCTDSIKGTNLGLTPVFGDTPTCVPKTAAATTAPALPAITPTTTAIVIATSGSSGGTNPLIWVLIAGALVALVAGGVYVFRRDSADDCAELRDRCRKLRADADAAALKASAAAAKAKAAAAGYDHAKAAREQAQKSAAAADNPNEGESWMEDADTGERITEHDLALERGAGGSDWGDPAARAQRRAQEKTNAHDALDAATKAEAAAKAASDAAAGEAKAADAAAATAEAAADAACKAAADCEEAVAAEAKRQAAAAATPPPPPPPPPPPATPTTTSAPAPPPPTTPPPPPIVKPPVAVHPRECEDGCEPETDSTSMDFELCVLALADIQIDGAFQFSESDVADAMRGFENFKTVADIGEFVEGFGEGGLGGIDAVLNTVTELVNQGFDASGNTNLVDPQSAVEDSVKEALDRLIKQVNEKRALGTWTMTCPLLHIHATCQKTRECQGGRWVVTKHTFTLEYGKKIRDVSFSADNWDQTNPGRGAVQTRTRLNHQFENFNKAATAKLKAMVKACAASH